MINQWRRTLRTPWVVCLILSNLVFLAIMGLRWLGGLQSLELEAYDLFLRQRPLAVAPDPRIVLIGATEGDLRRWDWPLTDALLAEALERVMAYRPQVIGLDIYRDNPIPPEQERLNAVLTRHKDIIAVMKFRNGGQYIPPPPVLQGTDQIGFVDVLTDPGGIVRRGLLFLDDGQTTAYSLALRLALRYLAAHGVFPQPGLPNPEYVRLGQVTLPPLEADDGGYIRADARGYQILLDFQGAPAPFQTFTLSDVLAGRIPAEAIRDKIVIIGVTAESVKDFFYTPFSRGLQTEQSLFGIALHAHITSQLLRSGLENTKPIAVLTDGQETAWIWLWTVLGGFIGLWLRSLWGFSLSATAGVVVIGLVCYGVFLQRWWIPVLPPALGWLMAAAMATAYTSSQERAQRSLLMQLFSRYIPRDVAEEIWRQREQFLKGGRPRPQRLTATVLFSDLQGFTSVSERLDPAVLMDWLNGYMETMARLVMAHGGIVDKFIGDAIMAVFGVPLARTDEAEIRQDAIHAVECALAMERELTRLNASWRQQGLPRIGIRIGIFTGPVVAGSLGSSDRLEYTVLGDTVNTASRLESFARAGLDDTERSCRILIGEATLQYLNVGFQIQRVGMVGLKGKAEEITVYQVLGRQDPGSIGFKVISEK